MSDKTGIEWTDATWADRGGRRVRTYQRRDRSRPGQQERRRQALQGLAWCRGCQDWLPAAEVTRQGACRPCVAAEQRDRYAQNPTPIRRRVQARRRGVAPLPGLATDYLTEQFGGLCAYCPSLADTWDHIIPVAQGGRTEPGNVVPACRSCNSSKNDREVLEWLGTTGRAPTDRLLDVLALGVAA